MKKILCKIITLGQHWWAYGRCRNSAGRPIIAVYCKVCGHIPGRQWSIYKKKFKGKRVRGIIKYATGKEKGRVTR